MSLDLLVAAVDNRAERPEHESEPAAASTSSDPECDAFFCYAYIAVFDEQEVSFALLRTLSEDDLLTKLRLPFGPARTIINALRAESELDDSDLSSSLASFRLLTDGP